MQILHVIPTQFPVAGYGGTERVAYWLGKAQAELGHTVIYLCAPGSRLDFARCLEHPEHLEHLDPLIPAGTDIVQLYGTPHFRVDHPLLVNIGGNGQPGEEFHPNTVFVSRSHAQRHGWREYVYNGIDLADYPLSRQHGRDSLFLAKASWRVKNLRGAMRIARKVGSTLHIAGGRAWFWNRGVVSHGMVDGQTKLRLLQDAGALLFPVIWEEPFGLAVVEALACGTPVVATPRGALPEIINPRCGVLADSFAELCQGLERALSGAFAPEACRQRVAEKFTHIHMAQSYLSYYKKVLTDGNIAAGCPRTPPDADPQQRTLYAGY